MGNAIVRSCPGCGTSNRIPAKHLADTGRCGACKAALPPIAEPIDADPAAFDTIVAGARVPVFVDFWASWCGPCRMAAPEVEALAQEMAGHVVVLKVNTEKHPELAARYRVQSIPNFLVLLNGRVAMQRAGVAPRAEMRRWIELAA